MKYVKIILQFIVFTGYSLVQPSQGAIPAPALKPLAKSAPKQINTAKTAPASAQPKNTTPTNPVVLEKIPYLQELQQVNMSPEILKGWQQLYDQFLQANSDQPHAVAGTAHATAQPKGAAHFIQNPSALKTLLTTNFFNLMAQYLNPTTFPKFNNDPDSQIHFNYATTHLRDTALRLGSISSITDVSGTPTTNFTGDCRDLGIIVNIQNNTDAQFSINQTSLDGTKTIQIGQINPGLNEVNLHTAALQNSSSSTNQTINYFEIVENITQPTITISLKILSGAELITFLKSLPHAPTNSDELITMNGLPTGTKYLANSADSYLVLMQNPSAPGSTQPNYDQQIQAINLSKLSGPYLLSMQLNEESIEMTPAQGKKSAVLIDVFQPSLNTVLEVKNKVINTTQYPLLILPQFLWINKTLQSYWTLLNSCLIAAKSENKFFGLNSFGNTFEYFTGLGCFDINHKYAFCIDLYNLLKPGECFHDASWLMGSALYETNLQYCSDLAQLHSSQDSNGNIVGNGTAFFYINFKVQLHPQLTQTTNNSTLFSAKGFFTVYTQPTYQLWTFLCSILTTEIKEGVFAELTEIQTGIYQLTWTNKKNKLLYQQILYFNDTISKINIEFLNNDKNWTGSQVPPHLLKLKVGIKNDFKVTYESMPTANKHLLSIQATSPIDRSGVIHITYLLNQEQTNQPLSTLYYDLYNTFQSSKFTRCQILQNGNLPSFLSNLTVQDWKNGIYIIPSVQNQKNLSPQNPGYLTVTFYKSDKTLLGNIKSKGLYQNDPSQPGIQHPVELSTTYSNAFKPMLEGSLTSGLLAKYKK